MVGECEEAEVERCLAIASERLEAIFADGGRNVEEEGRGGEEFVGASAGDVDDWRRCNDDGFGKEQR
jgi:hypothetical protein